MFLVKLSQSLFSPLLSILDLNCRFCFGFELQNYFSKVNWIAVSRKSPRVYNSACCCGCLFLLARDPIFTEPYYGWKWFLYALLIIALSFFFFLAAKEKKSTYNRGLCENAPNRARMWKAISALFYSHPLADHLWRRKAVLQPLKPEAVSTFFCCPAIFTHLCILRRVCLSLIWSWMQSSN